MPTAFGFLGGDRRQLYAAAAARESGAEVYLCGLEQAETDLPMLPQEELFRRCETIVLPLPVTRDGRTAFAPFAAQPIVLDEALAEQCVGKRVVGGMTDRLPDCSPGWKKVSVQDYYAREELTTGNAFLTAEAALALAITETEGSLLGARCLVTGFGRIGKALCAMLRGIGARVDCCARRPEDLAMIKALGCGALHYADLTGAYSMVFNTVPAPVLGQRQLARLAPDTVLMELASAPGGIDLAAAEQLHLRVIAAPSLPGRVSPRAAGQLLWQTITNMMEEC